MLLYQLENKKMDNDFMSKVPVCCRAVVAGPGKGEMISEGDSLVIQLSTGKKYKGRVLKFEHFDIGGYATGEITIIRI